MDNENKLIFNNIFNLIKLIFQKYMGIIYKRGNILIRNKSMMEQGNKEIRNWCLYIEQKLRVKP